MRRISALSLVLAASAVLVAATGCVYDDAPPAASTVQPTDPTEVLIADLASPQAIDRRDAAVDLTRRRAFEAEQAVMNALSQETDADAARADLYFLAGTGSPEARQTITVYTQSSDGTIAAAASDALALWPRYAPYWKPPRAQGAIALQGAPAPVASPAPAPGAPPAPAPGAPTVPPPGVPPAPAPGAPPAPAPGPAPAPVQAPAPAPAPVQAPAPAPAAAASPAPPQAPPHAPAADTADSEDDINP